MYPEVQKYFAEKAAAQKAYEDWRTAMRGTSPKLHDSEYSAKKFYDWEHKYHQENRAKRLEYDRCIHETRSRLENTATDPVILWMLENVPSYVGYMESVLEILPATREELETLANENDWCPEFDRFLAQATEAGVVPPPNGGPDVSEILTWISQEFDVTPRVFRPRIQKMVGRIVEKALTEQARAEKTQPESVSTV
jgi:hypothetical protein